MPAPIITSASLSFATQMPRAPASISFRATGGDLAVFRWGRTFTPASRSKQVRTLRSKTSRSTTSDGVSSSSAAIRDRSAHGPPGKTIGHTIFGGEPMPSLVNGVDFICVSTTDLTASREWYENVLGLEPSKLWRDSDPMGAEFETGSLTIALLDSAKLGIEARSNNHPIALHVDDVEAARAELESRG